jgi:hypothetical protein
MDNFRRVSLVEQEVLTFQEPMSSPQVFSGVRVTRSLVLYVCFVDRCLSFCTCSFGHCVLYRLLHVQNANCKYTEASNTSLIAAQTLQTVSSLKVKVNAAAYYTECCALLFAYSEYNEVGN